MKHIHDGFLHLAPYVRTLCGEVVDVERDAYSWINGDKSTCPQCTHERELILSVKAVHIGHRQRVLIDKAPQTFIVRENSSNYSYSMGVRVTGTLKEVQKKALELRVYAQATLVIYQCDGVVVAHNTNGRVWW